MSQADITPRRIAVIGGGPAGSFFALYALKYARQVGRDISVTIYEGKDFGRFGQPGCNMCAGLIPAPVVRRFRELDLAIPPELILGRISAYSLHTSAGILHATQPDPRAEVVSVFRGAGPRRGCGLGVVSFDALLLHEAVARGAKLRSAFVEAVRRGRRVEVVSDGASEAYDLVVLAGGVNGHPLALPGFRYRPPPTGPMCQTELFLGHDEVQRRLGSSVHIFLPPDEIATYGILIPKGAFVSASLLNARSKMRSLAEFLALEEVARVLGVQVRRTCGCLPKIAVGPASGLVDDGFVAVGDAAVTRLYKNGIGSALATAERAARVAVYDGCARDDFRAGYLPLCRAIDNDNRMGRLLFLQVPVLKRFRALPMAHSRVAGARCHREVSELLTRILWGMFTGTYSYRRLLRMAATPSLILGLTVALGRSVLEDRLLDQGTSPDLAPDACGTSAGIPAATPRAELRLPMIAGSARRETEGEVSREPPRFPPEAGKSAGSSWEGTNGLLKSGHLPGLCERAPAVLYCKVGTAKSADLLREERSAARPIWNGTPLSSDSLQI